MAMICACGIHFSQILSLPSIGISGKREKSPVEDTIETEYDTKKDLYLYEKLEEQRAKYAAKLKKIPFDKLVYVEKTA